MENRDKLKESILYLKDKAKKLSKKITLDFHNLETSILEAVLSRSDRSLGRLSRGLIIMAACWMAGRSILSMNSGLRPLKNQGKILIFILEKEALMKFYPGSILMSALK